MKEANIFMKNDLFSIVAEISAVSNIVTGLSNQLTENSDSLSVEAFQTALFGVSSYLERLADDLEEIEILMKMAGEDHETN